MIHEHCFKKRSCFVVECIFEFIRFYGVSLSSFQMKCCMIPICTTFFLRWNVNSCVYVLPSNRNMNLNFYVCNFPEWWLLIVGLSMIEDSSITMIDDRCRSSQSWIVDRCVLIWKLITTFHGVWVVSRCDTIKSKSKTYQTKNMYILKHSHCWLVIFLIVNYWLLITLQTWIIRQKKYVQVTHNTASGVER